MQQPFIRDDEEKKGAKGDKAATVLGTTSFLWKIFRGHSMNELQGGYIQASVVKVGWAVIWAKAYLWVQVDFFQSTNREANKAKPKRTHSACRRP